MRILSRLPEPAGAPLFKRFRSAVGEHVLVVPQSRVFDLPGELAAELDGDPREAARLAGMLAERSGGEADLDLVVAPRPQSVSLNVSSSCNLSCGYCYADRGAFKGGQTQRMTTLTALAAVDALLRDADPAHPVTVGFLGGEPLVNRALVHAVVAHAAREGAARGLDVRFSITTNGTLLNADDVALMRAHRFAVTVSVDGDRLVHDRQRPGARGQGSFERLAERLRPLLADPGRAQIAARMTVAGGELALADRLEAIWRLGFREAGVAPLREAADGSNLDDQDWRPYLAQLIEVSRGELERARQGLPIRLTNLAVALKQIHAGASSPYPCGAGGGYFSVAASGDWYACHRAVGEDAYRLGTSAGLDAARRGDFLEHRHVHAQTDCATCWARYLCSGGCHQEASRRSAASCDFVRDWLAFCLAAYCELGSARPQHFIPSIV